MNLFLFLTVVQAFVAAGLVVLVLMQRSEGGGLGVGGGGSPGGMLSARGAADFLTRATKWFAVAFVGLSIVLAAVAVGAAGQRDFDDTLDRTTSAPGDAVDATALPGAAADGEAAVAEDGAAAAETGEAADTATDLAE